MQYILNMKNISMVLITNSIILVVLLILLTIINVMNHGKLFHIRLENKYS